MHQRLVRLCNRGALVSFVFDDFPRTAYTVGGAILSSCGVRGTYYATPGLMNTSNELGEQFRADDLQSLLADGHELASHTFSHVSSRVVPISAFRQDIRKGQDAIRDITGTAPTGNFAYPYGDVTLAAKKALGMELMSCRGSYGGINAKNVDLNLLRANGLYGDVERLPRITKLLSDNEEQRGWVIFYAHDVRERPSPYGCTPRLLEASLSAALLRGANVLSVVDVLANYLPHADGVTTTTATYQSWNRADFLG